MSLDDRILTFALGCLVGFVLSYVVTQFRHERAVQGKGRWPTGNQAALMLVVMLTAFAAFASQKASNDSEDALVRIDKQQKDLIMTQERIERVSVCNQEFLTKTIVALNERTTYTSSATAANVALQKAQSTFLQVFIVEPPATPEQFNAALDLYLKKLKDFTTLAGLSADKVEKNKYPTADDLTACLTGAKLKQ